MDKTRREKDEWKIIDWRVVAKDFFPLSRLGRFVKKRVPQIFAIWAGVAALLRIPLFVSAFGAFGRNLNSPFFTVGRIGPNQSVDITAAFLMLSWSTWREMTEEHARKMDEIESGQTSDEEP